MPGVAIDRNAVDLEVHAKLVVRCFGDVVRVRIWREKLGLFSWIRLTQLLMAKGILCKE